MCGAMRYFYSTEILLKLFVNSRNLFQLTVGFLFNIDKHTMLFHKERFIYSILLFGFLTIIIN